MSEQQMQVANKEIECRRIEVKDGEALEPARVIAGRVEIREQRVVFSGQMQVPDCVPTRQRLERQIVGEFDTQNYQQRQVSHERDKPGQP